ncbi:MAG: hypothetical protein ACTMIR_15190 [Cellulomonadaceae bacterium]
MPKRAGATSPVQKQQVVLPRLFLSREHPRQLVDAQLRSGAWTRVWRGVYMAVDGAADRRSQRRAFLLGRISALFAASDCDLVFSHESAALLWGLPTVGTSLQVHVTQRARPNANRSRQITRHVADLPKDHVTTLHGMPVTTLERTMVDCGRALPPRQGLVLADAGLHCEADPAVCQDLVEAMAGFRGIARAREVIAVADSGAESPQETRVRFELLRAGLPAPETQVLTRTAIGDFWSDLGWPQWRLLLEYDGEAKYTINGPATDAVVQERRRERVIEDTGSHMERIVNDDLRSPGRLLALVMPYVPDGVRARLTPRPYLNG